MATATKESTTKKTSASAAHPAHEKAPRYIEAIGRRKTAIARVRLSAGDGTILVNEMDPKKYFTLPRLVAAAIAPLTELKIIDGFNVSASASPARSSKRIRNGKKSSA
jgi:Ribosomal protein S9/S16